MAEPLISLSGVRREFPAGEQTIAVLKDINLTIEAGEMVAIVGASGSGKSTLMNILGCLDRATSGDYRVSGRSTGELDPDELAELRREHFGFIFQRYHLIPALTASEQVEIVLRRLGLDKEAARRRAAETRGSVGLGGRLNNRPAEMSGGEKQRVAIARALAKSPQLIFADEPTSALDSENGRQIASLLKSAASAQGATVVCVTHDMRLENYATRLLHMEDGKFRD